MVVHHGVHDALLELLGGRDTFPRQVQPPERVHHSGQDLRAGEFRAGGKLRVFTELVQVIHLLTVEERNDAVGRTPLVLVAIGQASVLWHIGSSLRLK